MPTPPRSDTAMPSTAGATDPTAPRHDPRGVTDTPAHPDPAHPDLVWEAALDWLLRSRAAPEDMGLQQGLADWLALDSRHVEAYARAERVWRLTGHVTPSTQPMERAAHRPPARRSPAVRARTRAVRVWRRAAVAASALAACLLLVLSWPSLHLYLAADTVSGAGEISRQDMPDGSVVTLGARSALATHYGEAERAVTLLSGEAFFEVAPDKARPFSVTAGDTVVTAVGTAFDVRLGAKALTVEVAEGRVVVTGVPSSSELDVRLSAGHKLTIDRETGQATQTAIAAPHVASWRTGRLVVDQAPLAQVVARLRPYLPGKLLVTDEALLQGNVSGVYDLTRPLDAVRAAFQPAGATVHDVTPYLLVVTGE